MDDDEFDEDYDPRGMAQIGEDEPLDHDDSFEVEDGTEGQYDDSDIDGEELEEGEEEVVQDHFDEEEDPDEEMHDRGTTTLLAYPAAVDLSGPNQPPYRKVSFSFTPELA
jgi:anaphase-promoting complex subunit 10